MFALWSEFVRPNPKSSEMADFGQAPNPKSFRPPYRGPDGRTFRTAVAAEQER